MGELREPLTFTYAKIEVSHYNDSLAVDPTNPDVESSRHPVGANFVFCDGAVRSDEGPQFTTEPTAPEPYLGVKLENAIITSYSVGGSPLVGDGDSFGFGVEPEMKESGEKGGTDDLLIGGHTDFEPLATAFPGFAGGVRVASGDVNGDDDKPDVLVGDSGDGGFADGHNDGGLVVDWLPVSGDGGIIIDYTPGPDDDLENYDWPGEYAQRFDGVDKGGDTFDFQPQFTTEPTAPQDVEFSNIQMIWPYTMAPASGADSGGDYGFMDATFQGGTTVEAEPVLEGHQCLVFFLG